MIIYSLITPFSNLQDPFFFFHYRRLTFSRLDLQIIYIIKNNRFLKFVMHSLNENVVPKLSLTNSADLSAISFIKNGIFSVKSSNESKRSMVSFRNEINIPKCTCLDW